MTTRAILAAILLAGAAAGHADESRYIYFEADRIEYQSDVERAVWEMHGWYGGDVNKFWWKLEGENEPDTENELQLLYSRAISPYFDAQIGLRVADEPGPTETAFVVGIQGLFYHNIETDVTAFADEDGDYELRVELERDYRLTQRFVLQPRIDVSVFSAMRDQAAFELRLRYEVSRRLTPYIGVSWQRTFDDSLQDDSSTAVVAGLGFWF